MEPKLAPKSMKNEFQEALNKKDEKRSEKSHATVRGGVRGCAALCEPGGVGSLKSIHPEAPGGPA